MTRLGCEIRAIRQVVREVRDQDVPEVDWDTLEDRLMAQIERPARSERSWRWPALLAVATLTAGVAAGAVLWREDDDPAAAAPATVAMNETRLDGERLVIGQRIVAGTESVQVEHAGRASWTLAPHSSASLEARGERLVVALEFGSLVASVVPSPVPESFAVHAGRTRVAVRGTVFSVERRDDSAHVEVSQGTVSVGAVDGGDRSWLLSAPATGRFTLDGRRLDTLEVASAKPAPPHHPRPAVPAGSSGPAPVTTPAPLQSGVPPEATVQSMLPETPDPVVAELAANRAVDAVRRCFLQRTPPNGGVSISASSAMTLQFGPDGMLDTLQFEPPLAPDVQSCSRSAVQTITVTPSLQGTSISKALELG